jgi:hypothetical protein
VAAHLCTIAGWSGAQIRQLILAKTLKPLVIAAASCPETGGLASFAINLQFDRKRRNIRNRVNGGRSSELGNRLFVEAVIWKSRSGAPWRDLPERFGDWKNIHKRFSRWAASGVWEDLF